MNKHKITRKPVYRCKVSISKILSVHFITFFMVLQALENQYKSAALQKVSMQKYKPNKTLNPGFPKRGHTASLGGHFRN